MSTFRAGTLKDRITMQRRNQDKDEWGTPIPGTEAWIDVATVWADVQHKSGLGTIKADAEVSIVRASIRIRRRSGVDAGMRVLFDGQIYELKAVLPGPTREYIDLVCELTKGPTQ